jgi:hypothetical protein
MLLHRQENKCPSTTATRISLNENIWPSDFAQYRLVGARARLATFLRAHVLSICSKAEKASNIWPNVIFFYKEATTLYNLADLERLMVC